LADGPRGEGLDVDLRAGVFVLLVVPAGEGSEEDEADEREDDGDDAVRDGVSKGRVLLNNCGDSTYSR
jgi:hypothetical protein